MIDVIPAKYYSGGGFLIPFTSTFFNMNGKSMNVTFSYTQGILVSSA